MALVTKAIAVANYGDAGYTSMFYHATARNSDGTPARCRRNGACKTWKTRPDEFQLPVKHGLKECFYITERNAHQWYTTEDEARGMPTPA